mmetsp:Transcript_31210/g.76131  ORF Transcript_31210/g.76131 Transcript_31210/m.76131 type:complete len:150 (-) Transcript_31210:169-618(-)|eukprot:CAMPEP_0114490752 /NCGR_PEP_ID=MMETSP0109-20121206/2616_1 /TAXON_ID=29199 /ORGANISM="Chlorarachnion reptans, Strain CCCM449" /LENGTH=149 /DNA_ID=CAMNT_0001667403 /DNA_START=170 /DNA_END=619 /DNA_ORIENTATION=+
MEVEKTSMEVEGKVESVDVKEMGSDAVNNITNEEPGTKEEQGTKNEDQGTIPSDSALTEGQQAVVDYIYEALVDEVCVDVCFESHHDFYLQRHLKGRSRRDIFGNYPKNYTEQFKCTNCQRPVTSSKFAPHLEKCLGKGRNRSKRSDRY